MAYYYFYQPWRLLTSTQQGAFSLASSFTLTPNYQCKMRKWSKMQSLVAQSLSDFYHRPNSWNFKWTDLEWITLLPRDLVDIVNNRIQISRNLHFTAHIIPLLISHRTLEGFTSKSLSCLCPGPGTLLNPSFGDVLTFSHTLYFVSRRWCVCVKSKLLQKYFASESAEPIQEMDRGRMYL
jgi:hypothetical protein